MLPSAIAGSTRDFCASLPPRRTAVPPSTTVARYGSRISARPNASITSMISTAPPPNPPYSSANGRPSRPSSAYCDHSAVLQPPGSLKWFLR